MTDHIISLDIGESVEVSGRNLRIDKISRTGIVVESVDRTPPNPTPPPDPELVFEENFEVFPGTWVQDPPSTPLYFEQGDGKTHGGSETGPEGQTKSLRMKVGTCVKPAGCFPKGQRASMTRVLDLPAGQYVLNVYQVQHDDGQFSISLWDEGGIIIEQAGKWAAGEAAWEAMPDPLSFQHSGGDVNLSVVYEAPGREGGQSGIKLTGLRIWRV